MAKIKIAGSPKKTYLYPHEKIDQLEEQLAIANKRIAELDGELSMMTELLKRATARLRSNQ